MLKQKSIKQVLFQLMIAVCSLYSHAGFAQVGIGTTTPDVSAVLELSSTEKGVLLPRMTRAQRNAISNPADALMIFNITTRSFEAYDQVRAKWTVFGNFKAAPPFHLSDTTYLFVASEEGGGSGDSVDDPADFLKDDFWAKVQNKILTKPTVVQFLPGNYGRAYNVKTLLLSRIGNSNNVLVLRGSDDVIFAVEEKNGNKGNDYIIDVKGSQNIIFDDLHFTGNGTVNYVLRFTRLTGSQTKNMVVQNCSFTDMRGVYYGATGAHYAETSNIIYINNTFKRVGSGIQSHFIYNAYGATNVSVVNNTFEDCPGDFVRFRGDCNYGYVKGNTFKKTDKQISGSDAVFLMIPLFNNVNPGDESFPKDLAFIDNQFINNTNVTTKDAISYYAAGYNYPGMNYLLTSSEGAILKNGTSTQKQALLINNFGVDPSRVRLHGNTFSGSIGMRVSMQTFAMYGASSKGFEGKGDITNVFSDNQTLLGWEPDF